MKVQIKFEIECGEQTCASAPGEFCKFLGSKRFGSIPVCMLFNGPDRSGVTSETVLFEKDGWVQRCDDCLSNGTA